MPQKTVEIEDIGEVLIAKRRGAKYLRLSITSTGKVRVSLPIWAPYSAGINFAKARKGWIQENLEGRISGQFFDGMRIGKAHTLVFTPMKEKTISTRVTNTEVHVKSGYSIVEDKVQDKIRKASEKALAAESKTLLPQRLKTIANKNGFEYKEVKIKKLTSRWGSCSSDKRIALSFYLIQLPWDLIDYVLVHELIHTRHMNHGKAFWDDFKKILPDARALQREIRQYKPVLEPK